MAATFAQVLKDAKKIVALTGAGISAESGVQTFRGAGGLWRNFEVTSVATPTAFQRDPALVWEFYEYRREMMADKRPNPGHIALAQFEEQNKDRFLLITQNIDRLHQAAGSKNVLEIHGSLWETRCIQCFKVREDRSIPIAPALLHKGKPDAPEAHGTTSLEDLPHCQECQGLLRPNVVWFEESLDMAVLEKVYAALNECDLLLVIGTSSVVYPAASFAPYVKDRGGKVAEFNIERTPNSGNSHFVFLGPSGDLLPTTLFP